MEKSATFQEFMEKFCEATENDNEVRYAIYTDGCTVLGGTIDTLTYEEDEESVQLHTVHKDHDIMISKDRIFDVGTMPDNSIEYISGGLSIMFLG